MIKTMLPTGVVTFLFTDIEGSTQLWERDAGAMRQALADHDSILDRSVGSAGGVVFKRVGDAFCTAFSEVGSALQAAVDIQHVLVSTLWPTNSPIKVRIGIHTGTAREESGDYSGPTLNRVARIMSAGHGGQILVSSASHQLLEHDLPSGFGLKSLGVHHLKDLDRPEEIFQVTGEGLADDFPPLRTTEVEGPDLAQRARAAFQSKEWSAAADLLEQLENAAPLNGELLEMLASSLWWLGRQDEMTKRFEAAHNAFIAEGKPASAAMSALQLAEVHQHGLAPDVARAWERKAERLLAGDEDSVAKGYLLRWQTVRTFEVERNIDAAMNLSRRVMEIARARGDGNLEVLALQDQGRMLIHSGQVEEGMALMDEAMLAAMAGDVSPMVVGRSLCNMLAVCDQTGDIRRAGEWSDAAERWCSDHANASFPGVCRVYRAELLWHKGEWVRAEEEVLRASTELGFLTDVVGEAWYQYGEMRLRVGDDEKAEEAFQEALARGRQPVPGYAVLLARRGDLTSGIDLLERTLREPTLTPLDRARFLPTYLELTLDQGQTEKAQELAAELAEVARLSRSDFFGAHASVAEARIALARGDPNAGIDLLKKALRVFNGLGLPFEGAQVHAQLAKAYEADGAAILANLERKSAVAGFERLGATLEARALSSTT